MGTRAAQPRLGWPNVSNRHQIQPCRTPAAAGGGAQIRPRQTPTAAGGGAPGSCDRISAGGRWGRRARLNGWNILIETERGRGRGRGPYCTLPRYCILPRDCARRIQSYLDTLVQVSQYFTIDPSNEKMRRANLFEPPCSRRNFIKHLLHTTGTRCTFRHSQASKF